MEVRNHLVVNITKMTWGRGENLLEAMKASASQKADKMTYYIFKNDNWDITTEGTVTYDSTDLIFTQTINY